MEAEQLWNRLSCLFEADDGSLPEIRITNLSEDGATAIFSYFQRACLDNTNDTNFWSTEEEQDKPINAVPNAATLVVQGRAAPFHFVCSRLSYNGQLIPEIGVFVFSDQINLNYRMGREWNPARLKALFGILKDLKTLTPEAKVTIEPYALANVRKHFEATWESFLADTN